MPLSVPFYVHPVAAITAGKSAIENQTVTVTDDDLGMLQPLERLELATAIQLGQRIGASPFILDGVGTGIAIVRDDLHAAEATVDELQRLLAHRVEMRARLEAQRVEVARQQAEDEAQAKGAALRQQEEEVVAKRQAEQVRVQQMRTLEKWIVEYADDNQKARHKEGLLPMEEVLTAVTEHVFDDLETNERYSAIKLEEVCRCDCMEDVKFEKGSGSLTAQQYDHLNELRSEAPKGTVVEVVRHEGRCPSCDCEPVVRYSADMSLLWHGFTLKRRYLL